MIGAGEFRKIQIFLPEVYVGVRWLPLVTGRRLFGEGYGRLRKVKRGAGEGIGKLWKVRPRKDRGTDTEFFLTAKDEIRETEL